MSVAWIAYVRDRITRRAPEQTDDERVRAIAEGCVDAAFDSLRGEVKVLRGRLDALLQRDPKGLAEAQVRAIFDGKAEGFFLWLQQREAEKPKNIQGEVRELAGRLYRLEMESRVRSAALAALQESVAAMAASTANAKQRPKRVNRR